MSNMVTHTSNNSQLLNTAHHDKTDNSYNTE